MIRIHNHDLSPIRRRWVLAPASLVAGGDPVGGAAEEVFVAVAGEGGGHADGVVGGVDLPQIADQVVLPGGRLLRALVRDLPEDVVLVSHGRHDLVDIGLLETGDLRDSQGVDVRALSSRVRVAVDAVDVVLAVEGVAVPGVAFAFVVDRPAVEEHHRDVEAPLAGPDHPAPQALEVLGVEAGEVETGPAVQGPPGAGALVDSRVEVVRPGLMGPEADEVVPPAVEAVQVALEVEGAGALGVVDQVVPVVRAGEDDGAAFGVLEEVGVLGVDAEGHGCGAHCCTAGRPGMNARAGAYGNSKPSRSAICPSTTSLARSRFPARRALANWSRASKQPPCCW